MTDTTLSSRTEAEERERAAEHAMTRTDEAAPEHAIEAQGISEHAVTTEGDHERAAEQSKRARGAKPARRAFGPIVAAALRPRASEFPGANWLLGIIVGLGAACALFLRTLVPVPLGLADQGDGQQLLCGLGVASGRSADADQYSGFLTTAWTPYQWFAGTCPEQLNASSSTLVFWGAKLLTPLAGWGEGLDTRGIALISIVIAALLIGACAALLPGRAIFRVIVALLMTIVLADSAFSNFFVSSYSTTFAILGFLAIVVAFQVLWRDGLPTPGRFLIAGILLAFAVTSTGHMAAVLPAVAFGLLVKPIRAGGRWFAHGRRSTFVEEVRIQKARRVSRALIRRIPALVVLLALTGGAAAQLATVSPQLHETMRYNIVFLDLLPRSSDPEAVLEWFGADPALASSSGIPLGAENSAVQHESYAEFTALVTPEQIAGYAASHPEQIPMLADRAMTAVTQINVRYLGSQTEAANPEPYAVDTRWVLISEWFGVLYRGFPLLVAAVLAIALCFGAAISMRPWIASGARALGGSTVILVLSAVSYGAAVVVTQSGSELVRHMMPATFAQWLLLPVGVALVMLFFDAAQARTSENPSGVAGSSLAPQFR
ncbi:hypothetical protein [Humidisolicoccus flavus]|uniref:glycan biosynthesis hexose transferase WsfD n=1 Tax=Humidisolicoccus flavus TaxID=3111414 RepID=UPI003253A40F